MSALARLRAALAAHDRTPAHMLARTVAVDPEALRATLDRAEAAEAEVARLRAIVEGRTTAPTDVEIDAHAVAFGAWLVRFGVRGVDVRNDPDFARITRDAPNGAPTWWLPLDCAGRPCAWPVIA